MAVYQLIYRSVATRLLGVEELARMVEQARINNFSQAITGVLLYAEGRFLQLLEGEMGPVEAMYEDIRADARHAEVVRMYSAPVPHRLFAPWSMGFGRVTAPALARLSAYLDPRHRAALLPGTYDVGEFIADTLLEFVREEPTVTGKPLRP